MSSPAPVDSVLHTIGRTPLIRLRRLVEPGMADVVVKLEYFNPTGSYKDRLALAMVEGAELEIVQSDGGKVTPALFDRFKARIAAHSFRPGVKPTCVAAHWAGRC